MASSFLIAKYQEPNPPQAWVIIATDPFGQRQVLQFSHDPSADEILALLPSAQELRGSTLAARIQRAAELAQAWMALDAAATKAADTNTLPAWSALELARITAARDFALAALKAYV